MVQTLTAHEEVAGKPRGYEFNERENVVIRRTGRRSRTWGVMSLLWGFITLATGALGVVQLEQGPGAVAVGALYAISAIIPILIGINFLRAARSFGGVTESEGMDIPHLMRALESLGSALLVQIVTAIVGIVLFALGLAAALAFPLLAG